MTRAAFRPGPALSDVGGRAMMAAALPRVLRGRDRSSRAVASALATSTIGAHPPEERAWGERIEAHRRLLPADAVAVAGSGSGRSPSEHLAEAETACEWMSLPRTSARFLLRLVRELAPRSCLELGTGFGISTAYQAAGLELNGTGRITTLDIRGMMEIAAPGLSRLGLAGRVELVSGRIEDTMAGALDAGAPIDYAFLDADHTEIGTIAPFEAIVPHLSPGAVVVFDDINWTSEMRRAWRRVSARPEVVAAYGVHRLGVAIVGPDGGG